MLNDIEHPENDQPISNPLLEQIRREIQASGPWSYRFRALAEAIAHAGESKTQLTCHEVQDIFDVYVSDELKGDDVRLAYPEVWQHIQTCANCQHEHEVLLGVLSQRDIEAMPDFIPSLRPLSFLQPGGARTRWISRVRSRLAGTSFGLHIQLNPDFLRSKLGFGPSLQTARTYHADTLALSSKPQPLLVDDVSFDGQHLNIEINVARSTDRPNEITLHTTLTGSASLPDNLWIRLTWSGQTYTAPVTRTQPDEGYVVIGNIPLDRVRDALNLAEAQFEIVFETRDELADDDNTSSLD